MRAQVMSSQLKQGLRNESVLLALFAATMFLSALLLFSVQPMFAKMVLPRLGGSPSVWAISMCFFQAVLLAGYCYAHLVKRYLPPAKAPLVHLGLLAAAALTLPFGLAAGVEPPPGDAYFWLIGVLTAGVGLPFFAISASAPLLQSWFARTGHPHANDPYFLYGASNLGSLIALLAYPFAIEPVWGLAAQSHVWSAGFLLLAMMIALCGMQLMLSMQATETTHPTAAESDADAEAVALSRRLEWIGLAFVPSGLLVAFSSFLTTDVASAPFMWVIPLALYLATFIVVFRDQPLVSHRALLTVQPALAAMTFMGLSLVGTVGWMFASCAGIVAFVVTTLVAHRELFERRPATAHLTEFYLWMSFGGVLGGVFAAIIAPQIFNTLYEFPLLLMLGLACRPGLGRALAVPVERIALARSAVWIAVPLLAAFGLIRFGLVPPVVTQAAGAVLIVVLAVAMQLQRERPPLQLLAGAAAAMCLAVLPSALNLGQSERSFFGVHRILTEPVILEDGSVHGHVRMLLHGTTLHGIERIEDADNRPIEGRPQPTSYYHVKSPIVRALEGARSTFAARDGQPFTAAVVGLGAGTMACNAGANERWRFFEIDPVVDRIAHTRFSFLPKCKPDAEVVLGDARLMLAKEPARRFDYILIDAFSSNAIPVHLLTKEAIAVYLDKLAPEGVLALHISNRHLDLTQVGANLVAAFPGLHAFRVFDRIKASFDAEPSNVIVISRSQKALAAVAAMARAEPTRPTTSQVWTDDYSNILPPLLLNYWH